MEEEEEAPGGAGGGAGGSGGHAGLPGASASAAPANLGRSVDSGLDVAGSSGSRKRKWAGEGAYGEREFRPFPYEWAPGPNFDGSARHQVTQIERGGPPLLRQADAASTERRSGTQPDLGFGYAAWSGANEREVAKGPTRQADLSRAQRRRFNRYYWKQDKTLGPLPASCAQQHQQQQQRRGNVDNSRNNSREQPQPQHRLEAARVYKDSREQHRQQQRQEQRQQQQ